MDNKNFNFLTTINAIYNNNIEADEFNIFYNLLIFINDDENIIKIINNGAIYRAHKDEPLKIIKNQETILKNIGYNEYFYLLNIFNDNPEIFKNIIFYKFLDEINDCLGFDEIY